MTNEDQSVFTFDLNESLRFKNGQEVEEIMGISLEPEISIQEFNDFVSVRGVIELTGEYFQVRDEEEEQQDDDQVISLNNQPQQRFVERIESYADGVNEFFHKFPVEISIPKYRIDSVDDILVGIESFDYQLPENGQLDLNATIAIHGVKNEAEEGFAQQRNEENLVSDEPIPEPPEPPIDETFAFDIKEKSEEEPEDNREEQGEQTVYEESQIPVEQEAEHVPEIELSGQEKETSKEPEKEGKNRWKQKKTQTIAEFFGHGDQEDGDNDLDEESSESVSEEISSDFVSVNAYEDESDSDWESSREGSQQDSTYLLNIFADQDEETYTKMKICIVQDSDTLESIAEKYDVSPLNISKTNRLTDDDLTEGQILYIPSKVTKLE